MSVENLNSLFLGELTPPFITCPDYRFSDVGWKESQDGEGAALIILRNPKNPEILLGLHNSRDSEKHGRWSFFGETRKSGEESGLSTLSRGLSEELNLELSELELLAYDPEKIFQTVYKLPRRSQYYPGEKSFTVGVYTVWTEKDYSGYVGTNEIIETKYFHLDKILDGGEDLPLREFTLPTLHELSSKGILVPGISLRQVRFPV